MKRETAKILASVSDFMDELKRARPLAHPRVRAEGERIYVDVLPPQPPARKAA